MGSFLIGLTSVIPIFLITYPIFRLVAPTQTGAEKSSKTPPVPARSKHQTSPHQVVLIDRGHTLPNQPNHSSPPNPASRPNVSQPTPKQTAGGVLKGQANESVDFTEIESEPTEEPQIAIETRIDVVRMTDHRGAEEETAMTEAKKSDSEPMDEALNYLLRQLRDSQQRKAA